jgi:hypothetical protein
LIFFFFDLLEFIFTIPTLYYNSNLAYRLPLPGAMNIEI